MASASLRPLGCGNTERGFACGKGISLRKNRKIGVGDGCPRTKAVHGELSLPPFLKDHRMRCRTAAKIRHPVNVAG